MLRLPDSHRARVRLLWGSTATLVVAAIALLVILDPNSGTPVEAPISSTPAKVVHPPKTVKAPRAAKAAAEATLGEFVRTAVIRRRLATAWPLATPHMRVGTTRAQWLSGDLPVVPYPANAFRSFGLTLKYSYRGILGYDVLVLPKATKAGDKAGQQVYACELHDVDGRWLVDFCYPRQTL